MDIEIVGYDPRWPELYQDEKQRIFDAIGNLIVAIEHIGSTAVPELAAKPIIDIMTGVRRLEDASWCVEPLEAMGYEYVPQYEVFIQSGGISASPPPGLAPITCTWWRRPASFGGATSCSATFSVATLMLPGGTRG